MFFFLVLDVNNVTNLIILRLSESFKLLFVNHSLLYLVYYCVIFLRLNMLLTIGWGTLSWWPVNLTWTSYYTCFMFAKNYLNHLSCEFVEVKRCFLSLPKCRYLPCYVNLFYTVLLFYDWMLFSLCVLVKQDFSIVARNSICMCSFVIRIRKSLLKGFVA